MSDRPASPREELLQGYLAGELTREQILAAAGSEDAARLARELDELDALAGTLDAAGGEERAVLTDADTVSFPAGERATREFFARHDRGTGPRRLPFLLVALAAALVVVLGLWGSGALTPDRGVLDPEPDSILGTNLITGLEIDDDGTFRFQVDDEVSPQVWFVIRVYDEHRTTLLTESDTLVGTTWRPSDEEKQGWPPTIRWEVRGKEYQGPDLVAWQVASYPF